MRVYRVVAYLDRTEAVMIDLPSIEEARACGHAAWLSDVGPWRVDLFDLDGEWSCTLAPDGEEMPLQPRAARPVEGDQRPGGAFRKFRYRGRGVFDN